MTCLIELAEHEQLRRSITMSGVIHAMKAADVRGGTHRMQSELRIYIEVDSILIFKGTFHNSHYLVVLQRDYCGIMLKQHGPTFIVTSLTQHR